MIQVSFLRLALLIGFVFPATAEQPLRLSLPIACEPGKTCFVQNFVDVDPGPGVRDWRCGTATYDGHSGVDIRVLSAAAATSGVAVLAAAPGVVRGVRDGMTESLLTGATREAITGRDCGNGVVIDHAGGWQTQYCHMKPGSIRVRSGATVERGAVLGDVGATGMAQFSHVHLTVRRDGKTVDPYLGTTPDGSCRRQDENASGAVMWDEQTARNLAYRGGEFIQAGFAAAGVPHARLELDHLGVDPPGRDKDGLVFFARAINLQPGDRIALSITGPGGFQVKTTTEAMDRSKATYLAFGGRRRPSTGWVVGTYRGTAEIVRGGVVAGRIEGTFEMK